MKKLLKLYTNIKFRDFCYQSLNVFFLALTVSLISPNWAQSSPISGIIDIHMHVENMKKAEVLLEANKSFGITKTVLVASPIETIALTGNKSFTDYQKNMDVIFDIVKKYPDHFIPFCTVNPLDDGALEIVKRCVNRGGKGIKLYNGHSYYHNIFAQPLDSSTMMTIYEYAENNNLPLIFHINIRKYQDELEAVLIKFPNLVVNIPHYMAYSSNLELVGELLDRYPNLYTDISLSSGSYLAHSILKINNNAEDFKVFFKKYSDRLLFGSDIVLTKTHFKNLSYMKATLQCYKNLLEKETFACSRVSNYYKRKINKYIRSASQCAFKRTSDCKKILREHKKFKKRYKETKILTGLGLEKKILQKIYISNAEKFLSGKNIAQTSSNEAPDSDLTQDNLDIVEQQHSE